MSELGQSEQGVTDLEAVAATVPKVLQISKSRVLTEVYLHVGRAEEVLIIIGEELAEIELSGAHQEAAELYRLKSEAILMRDSSATVEAEACFRKAIEIAKGRLTCFRGLRHLRRSRATWRGLPSRAKSTLQIPTTRTDPPDRGINSCVSSHPTRRSPESDTRWSFAQAHWYNLHRRHSALDYLSPINYERCHYSEELTASPPSSTQPGYLQLLLASFAYDSADLSLAGDFMIA